MSLNSVFLTGHVVPPCELRTSKAGKSYCQFKFMSVRQVRDVREETEVACAAYGALAEKITKEVGNHLFIAGRLKTDRWEWQGKQFSKTVISVDEAHAFAPDGSSTAPVESLAPDVSPTPAVPAAAASTTDEPPF
jgi:single-stranded DNA-binding protein